MTRQPKDLQLQVAILTARVEQLQERIERSLERLAARESALPERDKESLGIGA